MYINGLNVVDNNSYSYCVDMLRLKCEISITDFRNKVENRLNI